MFHPSQGWVVLDRYVQFLLNYKKMAAGQLHTVSHFPLQGYLGNL